MWSVVLIDEIETHLHLELQRVILPILTTIFPNIQFVVTTHSPFILNSLENAVAFDLEHREPIEDLTDYSYEALAEGYFGVRTDSSEIQMRLQRLEEFVLIGFLFRIKVSWKCIYRILIRFRKQLLLLLKLNIMI